MHWDLAVARYKVFDHLGMALQGRYDLPDQFKLKNGDNIWVGLSNVYVSTTAVSRYAGYLRYMDLQLDQGRFDSEQFRAKVRNWDKDDIENDRRLANEEEKGRKLKEGLRRTKQ